MSPKEKAWSLVQKQYSDAIYKALAYGVATTETAKKCALICVNEIMAAQEPVHDFRSQVPYKDTIYFEYWDEVRKQIELL